MKTNVTTPGEAMERKVLNHPGLVHLIERLDKRYAAGGGTAPPSAGGWARNLLRGGDFTNRKKDPRRYWSHGSYIEIEDVDGGIRIRNTSGISGLTPDWRNVTATVPPYDTGAWRYTVALCDVYNHIHVYPVTGADRFSIRLMDSYGHEMTPRAYGMLEAEDGALVLSITVSTEDDMRLRWAALYDGLYDEENLPMCYSNDGIPEPIFELLWKNNTPGSSYAAQTVPVPKYDWYLVRYTHTSASSVNTQVIRYGEDNILPIVISTANNRNGTRHATPGENGIEFSACTYNGTTTNGYAVPLEIYGIN